MEIICSIHSFIQFTQYGNTISHMNQFIAMSCKALFIAPSEDTRTCFYWTINIAVFDNLKDGEAPIFCFFWGGGQCLCFLGGFGEVRCIRTITNCSNCWFGEYFFLLVGLDNKILTPFSYCPNLYGSVLPTIHDVVSGFVSRFVSGFVSGLVS